MKLSNYIKVSSLCKKYLEVLAVEQYLNEIISETTEQKIAADLLINEKFNTIISSPIPTKILHKSISNQLNKLYMELQSFGVEIDIQNLSDADKLETLKEDITNALDC